jgi:hypothetical protein
MHSKSKNKSKQTIYLCRVPLCPEKRKYTKRKTANAHTRKQHPNLSDIDTYLYSDEEPESEKKVAKIAQQEKEKAAKAIAKEATKKSKAAEKEAAKKLAAEAKAALKQSQVGAKAAKKPDGVRGKDKRSRVNGMSTDSNKKSKTG